VPRGAHSLAREAPPGRHRMIEPVADPIANQNDKWTSIFAARPDFLGAEPSEPGRAAMARFAKAGVNELLELGPGQGRDTLLFAGTGMHVTALDYTEPGLERIAVKAEAAGLSPMIRTLVCDVRQPLPLPEESADACYAHMLLCMALTTDEIERLIGEVRRVLRPGRLFIYTVRTTADAHFRVGVDHGDDRWEMGGFIVHFFDRSLIDRLAEGWDLLGVTDHEEGKLPRRLAAVTMRKV
jgi:SAM-dependent methyltransferase